MFRWRRKGNGVATHQLSVKNSPVDLAFHAIRFNEPLVRLFEMPVADEAIVSRQWGRMSGLENQMFFL